MSTLTMDVLNETIRNFNRQSIAAPAPALGSLRMIAVSDGSWRERSWRGRWLPGWLRPFEPWVKQDWIPSPLAQSGKYIIDKQNGVVYGTRTMMIALRKELSP